MKILERKPLIVAHRGDSQHAPESTLAAFEQAILRGADTIECDVHMTKDGELAIHHDYHLGRTEDGEGYLGDFTLAELKQFDVGSWFGKAWSGERMPTLDEVLICGKGRVRFELEIRTPTHDCIKRVLESIVRHDVCEMVEITSPHLPVVYQIKALGVPCRCGIFFEPCPDWMQPSLRKQHILSWMILSQAHVAHIPESLIEVSFVSALRDEGFLVHGADLNTGAGIQHGLQAGLDQFSTDMLSFALQQRKEYS